MQADLIHLSFRPKLLEGLHKNNILEFISIIINLWLAFILFRHLILPPTGFILKLVSHNISGLSWLAHAACTDNPSVQLWHVLFPACSRTVPAISSVYILPHSRSTQLRGRLPSVG
jgi:hypothetical protein